jgi:hypothetical protein
MFKIVIVGEGIRYVERLFGDEIGYVLVPGIGVGGVCRGGFWRCSRHVDRAERIEGEDRRTRFEE